MRDFFDHQEQARVNTRWLIFLFLLAILATVVAVYLAAVLISPFVVDRQPGEVTPLWRPVLLLWVSLSTLLLILAGSLSKMASLQDGGGVIARLLGGREVDFLTRDPDERRLVNVVEEMAIASGTPVPRIFLIDGQDGINAFAAGWNPSDAVITVTWGALEELSRDELQGVIAHEFSHIAHGDMRLNVRLMGWVFGILLLGMTGRGILEALRELNSGRRKGRGGKFLLLLLAVGISLWIIGYLGFFITRLLKSAVSRQREFLADATAVQYTRNPSGLARALAKIAERGSRLEHPRAEEASHLFFANGMKPSWASWTATHPPLEERIQRLDPDGIYLQGPTETPGTATESAPTSPGDSTIAWIDAPSGPPASRRSRKSQPNPRAPDIPVDPDVWIERAGKTTPHSLAAAAEILRTMPRELAAAARDPRQARALFAALLLDDDQEIRHRQLADLDEALPMDIRRHVDRLAPVVDGVSAGFALPLVDLSLPTLRRLSPERYRRFRTTVRSLAKADGRTDLFELVLERVLVRHLDSAFHPAMPSERPRLTSLAPVTESVATLLSALAFFGHGSSTTAASVFYAGLVDLGGDADQLIFKPQAHRDLTAVGDALDELADASPALHRKLLKAAVRIVLADRDVTIREAELLRAVADGLRCPVPPLPASAVQSPASTS